MKNNNKTQPTALPEVGEGDGKQCLVDKWLQLSGTKRWKVKLESENKKVLLQNRMLEIEIIDIEDVGINEMEDCLWEMATEVE